MTSGSALASSGQRAAGHPSAEPGAVTFLQRAVLEALEAGPLTAREVGERVGRTDHAVRSTLLILNGKGLVRRDQNASPVVWWRA